MRDGLREAGFGFKDIAQIVVTHIHPDHYGLTGRVKQLSGANLSVHRIEADLIHSRYVNLDGLLEDTARQLRCGGVPQNDLPQLRGASLWMKQFVTPAAPEIRLSGGEKLSSGSFEFEVLWTPGHSPGHICLYEPKKKLLFSGDHILPDITSHVGLHPQSGENPLGDFINSMRAIEKLEVNFVFPGHGAVFSGLKQRIGELLYHYRERKMAIIKSVSDELKTAYQIATEILWRPESGGVPFQELELWDKRLAVMETLAHLQLLMTEGKVEKVVEDDAVLYWAGG